MAYNIISIHNTFEADISQVSEFLETWFLILFCMLSATQLHKLLDYGLKNRYNLGGCYLHVSMGEPLGVFAVHSSPGQ